MTTKTTLVEIKHNVGYGENLLEYLNISLREKDMIGVRVVDPSEVQKPKGLQDPCSESGITAWHPLEVAKQWPRGCAVLRRWMRREYDLYGYAVIVSWNPKPYLPFEDDAEFARID